MYKLKQTEVLKIGEYAPQDRPLIDDIGMQLTAYSAGAEVSLASSTPLVFDTRLLRTT